MGFLKRLFGSGSGPGSDRDGLYYFVQSDRTGEVIQLRLHRFNDLSIAEDGQGYYVRKVVVGEKGFDRIEVEFSFDKNRKLVTCEIHGGELVDRDAYDAYRTAQGAPEN